jgi:D-alanyl-D-alanine dipeptidase
MPHLDIRPIPEDLPRGLAWKQVPIRDIEEKLVPLGPFSSYGTIFTSAIYFGEHDNSPYVNDSVLPDALITMFVRESVAKRLIRAQASLPENMRLVVLDSYRTPSVQESLFHAAKIEVAQQHPDWNAQQLSEETQRFVSAPSNNPQQPMPHGTGGPVDLAVVRLSQPDVRLLREIERQLEVIGSGASTEATILEFRRSAIVRRATWIEFGTAFDDVSEKATLSHFERIASGQLSQHEVQARDNRRLLYTVMTDAGFLPYAEEWWHFNPPECQMGAWVAGLPEATFGSVGLSSENLAWETFRKKVHHASVKIHDAASRGEPDGLGEELDDIRRAVMLTGDQRQTGFGLAERIGRTALDAAKPSPVA